MNFLEQKPRDNDISIWFEFKGFVEDTDLHVDNWRRVEVVKNLSWTRYVLLTYDPKLKP